MERLWFAALDTLRRRATLYGSLSIAARHALIAASRITGVRIVNACVLPAGVRVLARAPSKESLRRFLRRLVAVLAARAGTRNVRWRPSAQIKCIAPSAMRRYQDYLARCRYTGPGGNSMSHKPKRGAKATLRSAGKILQSIEHANEAMLGMDEAAARVRRYVAAHDAPQDDRSAFARLCLVIFAQGLNFEAVEKHRGAIEKAFCRFDPALVARITKERVGSLLREPIIRNRAKIEACIENARRWNRLALDDKSYLGRMARMACGDDASAGWPKLAAAVEQDFLRLKETAARTTLKRWGFFTAAAHPGSTRLLRRLGLLEETADGAAVQRFVGSLAQALGKHPYAVEAALAIFAGAGPCGVEPRCSECVLRDGCPNASLGAVAAAL